MLPSLILALLCLSIGTSPASADGAIGCSFSSVCQSYEVCIDDRLFGICIPAEVAASGSFADLITDTSNDQKSLLSYTLRVLAKSGYTWKDEETQCVMKWLIESFKADRRLDPPDCLFALNEPLPGQGQKRVSESLAHAFQSYLPQDGGDENEHIIEKYPRIKNSIVDSDELSRLGRIFADGGKLVEVDDLDGADGNTDGDDEEDDDEMTVINSANAGRIVPVVVEEGDDDSSDDDEAASEVVFGPQLPQLRTGGMMLPPFGSRLPKIDVADDDLDDDDDDERKIVVEMRPNDLMNRMMYANLMADERLDRVLDDKAESVLKPLHHETASVVSSDVLTLANGLSSKNNNGQPSASSDVKVVETNYAYVVTEPIINTATAASAFLDCAVSQLGEDSSKALIILDSWHGEIVFEVRDPAGKSSASSIAKEIESNADKIRTNCNRHVRAVGIGRRAHLALRQQEAALAQTAEAQGSVSRWSATHAAIVAILVIVSTSIAGSIVVFVLLRHAARQGTLKHAIGTVQGKFRDWKSRHFYEDLCRESIAAKGASVKGGALGEVVATSGARQPTPPPSPPPWAEEPRPTDLDVSTAHVVLAYMEEHLKNRSRLEEEWGELCGYSPDRSDLSVANLAENASKNRDINVVPYDHNRVKLCSEANAFKSDYINASHIVDVDPRRPAYVVTQTPLPETVADFWQLVWEQKSTLIVYLSQPNEAKTVRYWPEEGLTLYHRWQVGLVSEHAWNEDFIVRSLVLKDTATGDSRTVTQFHFLAWPSDDVPKLCRSILAFRRKANRSYRPHASPVIVQSTNGSGRAGTYVLLDMTLNHIAKGAREVDISANLEHLRDQRTGLVKTKEQFEFVLICVAEEIAAIVKSSRDGSGNSSPE